MFSIASEEALVDRVLSRLEELAAATPEPIPPSVSDQDWARQTMLNRDHLPWADVERAKKILGIVEPTAEEMMKEAQEELARRNAAAAATGQRSADMALLTQVAAGQHPQMLEPELADLIEAALERHPDDAEVQTEGERAITAYSNGLLSATGG
jgi:hypothetical protein